MNFKDSLHILGFEIKNTLRDPMMLLLMGVPFFFVGIIHFALPLVEELLKMPGLFNSHRLLILSMLLVISPLLFGAVSGLSILDDRDGGVITALSVTPPGKTGYLYHKLIIPLLIGWVGTVFVIPASGLILEIRGLPLQFLLLTFTAGSEALLLALFLGAFADNKIQGLVFMKGMGILFFPGVFAYFFSTPLLYLAAPIPMFWLMKAGYLLGAPEFWLHLVIGMAVHTGWIIFFISRFIRKI